MKRENIKKGKKILRWSFIGLCLSLIILQTTSIASFLIDNVENIKNSEPTISFNFDSVNLILPLELENKGIFDISEIAFSFNITNATNHYDFQVIIPRIPAHTTLNTTFNMTLVNNEFELNSLKFLINSSSSIQFKFNFNIFFFPIELKGNGTFIRTEGM